MSDIFTLSLRDLLRFRTAEAHARIDGLFGSCDLGSRAGYERFLMAQSVAWESWSPVLDERSQSRARALRGDLAMLGVPVPRSLPILMPAALSLGHRYVIEGSRLGSAFLLRRLGSMAPELARQASAYLEESAKIEAWRELSTALQYDHRSYDSPLAIVDDALFVFGSFERAWRVTYSAQMKAAELDPIDCR